MGKGREGKDVGKYNYMDLKLGHIWECGLKETIYRPCGIGEVWVALNLAGFAFGINANGSFCYCFTIIPKYYF